MYRCVEMFCARNKKVARNLAKYVYLSSSRLYILHRPNHQKNNKKDKKYGYIYIYIYIYMDVYK